LNLRPTDYESAALTN